MRIIAILLLSVIACMGQQTNRTPILRGFLQTPLDGNAKAATNFANPTNPQDLATKDYVDNNAGGGGTNYHAGQNMTAVVNEDGSVTFSSDVSAIDVINLQGQVDSLDDFTASLQSDILTLPSTNAVLSMIATNPCMVTVSARGIANGRSALANNGANFGPDTVGTVTSGFQEALDSFSKGANFGPTAAQVQIKFSGSYLFFTNPIVYSNVFTTGIKFLGDDMLTTKLVFAGTNKGVSTITIRGGGHAGASLDLPLHVFIQDIGFTAINETTNVLLTITNTSAWELQRCNFTSWLIMTNQDWGSAMSINGQVYYPNDQGLVGLSAGNLNDHGGFMGNCYFAGLATGMAIHTDHFYLTGVKFAMVGLNGDAANHNLWPNTHPYSLGAAILRWPGLDSHYYFPHFYVCHGGLVLLNSSGQSDPNWMVEPITELTDFLFAASDNTTANILLNADDSHGADWTSYKVNSGPYAYAAGAIKIRRAVYDNPANPFDIPDFIWAAGLKAATITNTSLASKLTFHDSNGKEIAPTASGAVPINADGTATTNGQATLTLTGTNCTFDVAGVTLATNVFSLSLTTNSYFAQPSNLSAGKSFLIYLKQNSAGTWAVNFNTTYWKFPNGQILTTTSNANALSALSCVVDPTATSINVIQSLNFQ